VGTSELALRGTGKSLISGQINIFRMTDDEGGKRFVLFTVSFALQYIRGNRDLSENNIRSYFNMAPEYFRYMQRASLKEIVDLLEKYRKGTFYSRDIELVLSPEGRKWLERNIPIIKRATAGMDDR
jgi:hypothetical protein